MVGPYVLMKMLHCMKMNRRKKRKKRSSNMLNGDDQSRSKGRRDHINVKIEQVDEEEYDENLCRVCLKEGCIDIYGSEDLSEDLYTFAGLLVSSCDRYPKKLCENCNALLQGAILFRKTAQDSDRILRHQNFDRNVFGFDEIDTDAKDMLNTSGDDILDTAGDVISSPDEDYDNDDDPTFDFEIEMAKVKKKIKKEKVVKSDVDKLRYSIFKVAELDKEIVKPKDVITTYFCKRCDLEFKTMDEFNEHRLSSEHENRRKNCPICNKSYKVESLKAHLLLHGSKATYICDVCGKTYVVPGHLTRHRVTHFVTELAFKCNLCPYRGRFKESLKMHMRTHTGDKPYKCSQCPNRAFVNKSNLNKHLLTHRNTHDFKCSQCQRGFFKKRELDLHYKVEHSGIKDHICNICGKPFGYRKQMMKHQLKVHKREKLKSGRTPLYMLLDAKQPIQQIS